MKRCLHRNAMVIVSSPGPGILAERWCPECGAYYGPMYTRKSGWKNSRRWNAPGGAGALAYVALCEEVRADDLQRRKRAREILP